MVVINIIDAGHGDCLLLEIGNTLILIDSGPERFQVRRNTVAYLKKVLNGREIDLAVVTHDDDDHIGGFLNIVTDKEITIKKYLFNSLDYLNKVFREAGKKISYRQSVILESKLHSAGININSIHYIPNENTSLVINDVSLKPISPTIDAIKILDNKYKKIKISKTKELDISDCYKLILDGNDSFKSDNSPTNKASLALIIENSNFRGLFLADAHEKDVTNYFTNENVDRKFDVVKLSHHGSEKNTSLNLLNILETSDYIICANKSHHNHPNNKTLARILYRNKVAKIHFSSNNKEMTKIKAGALEIAPSVSFTYPDDGVNRLTYE